MPHRRRVVAGLLCLTAPFLLHCARAAVEYDVGAPVRALTATSRQTETVPLSVSVTWDSQTVSYAWDKANARWRSSAVATPIRVVNQTADVAVKVDVACDTSPETKARFFGDQPPQIGLASASDSEMSDSLSLEAAAGGGAAEFYYRIAACDALTLSSAQIAALNQTAIASSLAFTITIPQEALP